MGENSPNLVTLLTMENNAGGLAPYFLLLISSKVFNE
jgi:hypothetical protein